MLLLLAAIARAAIPNAMLRGMPVLPKLQVLECSHTSPDGTTLPPIATIYYFDQLIDHNNAGFGTFQQRYWNEVRAQECDSNPVALKRIRIHEPAIRCH
ncbi:hypothetical protein K503DRAFT_774796 [Rhizopogon vinicolor AM-OR11-026]|uniref:Uncharacterized protein n=1 Tax=Rhizopogon vinicolor AM-OR11-026 TaxID=1314800 RepID=A0A1B7MNN2_9AGAM|nr:hypothetical protein K503DRAFT_774796 [Rhizopogon vinicolor AM-OR11-026]